MSDRLKSSIEKKNLEAHVELCAERYHFLEEKLDQVESKVSNLTSTVDEINDMLHEMTHKRNDQLVSWGVGIIGTLLAVVGYLITTHILK